MSRFLRWVCAGMVLLVWETSGLAREWVALDGRKLEAEFVSATDDSVTIKRASDGRKFTIALETLSEADRKWVAEQGGRATSNADAPGAPTPVTGPYASQLTGDWELAEYRRLPYTIYGGADLDGSKKYPLIIGLHGKSDNNENGKQKGIVARFAQKKRYEKHPAILVAPLCYQPYGGTGGGWGEKPGKETIGLIKDLIKKLPIVDPKRVYLLGTSMGGGGTASLISSDTKLFAAGIVICGWADSGAVRAFKKVPVWAFHGEADMVVKPDSIRRLADTLKRSKIFKYTEFPGAGHNISGQVFADEKVYEWLYAQKRS